MKDSVQVLLQASSISLQGPIDTATAVPYTLTPNPRGLRTSPLDLLVMIKLDQTGPPNYLLANSVLRPKTYNPPNLTGRRAYS